jgi:acetyl esterase/lipase
VKKCLSILVVLTAFLSASAVARAQANVVTATKRDVSYGSQPHQMLDLYIPSEGAGPFPVTIWFGRLWQPGKVVPPVQKSFSSHCAVVAVETRVMKDGIDAGITPPISVCMLDARRATQFVRMHATEWNLDPRRIATIGSSQGSLLALYVGCSGEQANPTSADPVERVSTTVTCVVAHRSQPSIDPKRMQEWVPGVQWGAPAFGCSFAESLRKRDELLPAINQWSPDALLNKDTPPIYFEYNWGLSQPDGVKEMDYLVHSPRWALGFQQLSQQHGVTCYVRYAGHPSAKYNDMWDFLAQQLSAGSAATQPAQGHD